jgi:hypothetical protein
VEVTGNGRTLAGLEVLDGRVISRQEIRRVDEGELLGGGDACALFLELVVIHRRHLCKPKKKDGCTSSRASISVAVTGGRDVDRALPRGTCVGLGGASPRITPEA